MAPGPADGGGTVELIQGLLLAFAIVVILMPGYIRLLRYVGFGKQIREEGPSSHQVKEGHADRRRRPAHPGRRGPGPRVLRRSIDASTFSPLAALAWRRPPRRRSTTT